MVFDAKTVSMLVKETWRTLYMVGLSSLISYLIGIPLGVALVVTDKDGKLVWECPSCGNRDQNKMDVARRTCGYIGTQFWNQGRTQEIKERVLHL